MRTLVTGGAGFVGANVAIGLAGRHPGWEVVSLDNLHRPGSYPLKLGPLPAAAPTVLAIPTDAADARWELDLAAAGPLTVCPLGPA